MSLFSECHTDMLWFSNLQAVRHIHTLYKIHYILHFLLVFLLPFLLHLILLSLHLILFPPSPPPKSSSSSCIILTYSDHFNFADSWFATTPFPLPWFESFIYEWEWCPEPSTSNCISNKSTASGFEPEWFVIQTCCTFSFILVYLRTYCRVSEGALLVQNMQIHLIMCRYTISVVKVVQS